MKYIGIYNDPKYGPLELFEEDNFDNQPELTKEYLKEIAEDGGVLDGCEDQGAAYEADMPG